MTSAHEPSLPIEMEDQIFHFQGEDYALTGFHEDPSHFHGARWTVVRARREGARWYSCGSFCDFDAALVAQLLGSRVETLKSRLSKGVR